MLLPGCWFRMPWARATLRASCRCSLFSKAKTVCSILGRGYHRSVRLMLIKTKKPPESFAISHLVPMSFSRVCLYKIYKYVSHCVPMCSHLFPMFSKFSYHVGPIFVPACCSVFPMFGRCFSFYSDVWQFVHTVSIWGFLTWGTQNY